MREGEALLWVLGEPEVTQMAEGGLVVKFDAEQTKPQRCYAVAFARTAIPKGTQKITIEIERS